MADSVRNYNKGNKTKNAILEAAIVLFAKRPRATLDDVADAARVGRATVYRLFGTRNSLMKELMLMSDTETFEAVDAIGIDYMGAEQALMRLLEALIPMGARYRFLSYEPEPEDPEIAATYTRWYDLWRTMCVRLKEEGVIAPDIPDSWFIMCVDGILFNVWNGVNEGDVAVKQAPALAARTLLRGLSP